MFIIFSSDPVYKFNVPRANFFPQPNVSNDYIFVINGDCSLVVIF